MHKDLPSGVCAAIVVVVFALVGCFEWSALNAKDRRDHPVITLSREKCTSCHSDSAMIAKMREKEGHSTHSLFAGDAATLHAGSSSVHAWLHSADK
jgi:hypothetical protein